MTTSTPRRSPPRLCALAAAVASCYALSGAWANPTGPQVVHGQATFAAQGGRLTITNTPNTVINWQGFSIGANEVTRFVQQSASSAVLNRVVTPQQSEILGALLSNGRVFLINPNGILIGRDARIDVSSLVASTLNIRDQDFLGDRLHFEAGAIAGAVHNQGSITTASGGVVYLIGGSVTNSGIVRAPDGSVMLAAGSRVKLGDSAAPGVGVEFVARDEKAVNLGRILTPGGSTSIFAGLIEQHGTVRADSVAKDASGRIVFRAARDVTLAQDSLTSASGERGGSIDVQAAGGAAVASGTVEARGATGAGGRVQLTGERVALASGARLDASGALGGGTVLIGGGARGQDARVQNAQVAYLAKGSVVRADSLSRGDGGGIVVWSQRGSRIDGLLSARGGPSEGDGGSVETSSGGQLAFRGEVDVRAPAGRSGSWLLDPLDLIIRGGGAAGDNDAQLDANVPVGDVLGRIQFGDDRTLTYTVSEGKLEATDADIVMSARRSITVAGTFDNASGNPGDALGRLVLRPGRSLRLETINGPTDGAGGIDLTGSAHGTDLAVVVSGSGSIELRAGVAGTQSASIVTGALTANTGNITLAARTQILLGGKIVANGGSVQLESDTLAFGAQGSIANPAGLVSILPLSTAQPIVLGRDVPGLLSITSAMLNRIDVGAGGEIQISGGGPIEVRDGVDSGVLGTLTLVANNGIDVLASLRHAGTLKLNADRLSIPAPGAVQATTVVIEPLDRSVTNIVLGGSGGSGELGLSVDDLSRIMAPTLQLNGGPQIRLASNVTFNPVQVNRVIASSKGTISDGTTGAGGSVLTVNALELDATGGIDFTTNATTLSARNSSTGSLFLRDTGSGTLRVQALESSGGPLDLVTSKNLQLDAGATARGALSLQAGGGLALASGQILAGSDILLRGNGSATPGFTAGVGVDIGGTVGDVEYSGSITLVSTGGPIALAGSVVTTGTVTLDSAGGAKQSGGAIQANALALTGGGIFDLQSGANDVRVLAASLTDASLAVRTSGKLTVGMVGNIDGVGILSQSGALTPDVSLAADSIDIAHSVLSRGAQGAAGSDAVAPGASGTAGGNGRDGGRISIIASGAVTINATVTSRGGDGGAGGNGANGLDGAPGTLTLAPGAGTKGGDSGRAGNGGRAGDIELQGTMITVNADLRSIGGAGGNGGAPGAGGKGGDAAAGSNFNGGAGGNGGNGSAGNGGDAGSILLTASEGDVTVNASLLLEFGPGGFGPGGLPGAGGAAGGPSLSPGAAGTFGSSSFGSSGSSGLIQLTADVGNIVLGASPLQANQVNLSAPLGGIVQDAAGQILTSALSAQSAHGTALAGATNIIDAFHADNSVDGNITLTTDSGTTYIGSVRNRGGDIEFNDTNVQLWSSTIEASGAVRVTGGRLEAQFGSNRIDAASVTTDMLTISQFSGPTTLTGNALIQVNTGFDWLGGTLAGSGTLTTRAGSVSNLTRTTGDAVLGGTRTWNNAGAITIGGAGTGSLVLSMGTMLNNSGTLTIASSISSTPSSAAILGPGALVNAGTLTKTSPGSVNNLILAPVTNDGGTIAVGAGMLTIDRLTMSSGTIDNSVVDSAGAGTLSISGGFAWRGGRIAGASTVQVLDRADLTVRDVVTLDGVLDTASRNASIVAVVMNGAGTASNSGVLRIGSSTIAPALLNAGTLRLDLDVKLNGGFDNAAGATVDLTSGLGSYTLTLADGFTNSGTLRLPGSTLRVLGSNPVVNLGRIEGLAGPSQIAAALDNRGTVAVTSGMLELTRGSIGPGGYTVATGAQIKFSAGSYTLASIGGNGSVVVTGAGTAADVSGSVTAAAATIVNGGRLSLGNPSSLGSLTIDGGTLAGAGDVITGTLNLLSGSCAGTGSFTAGDVNWSGGSFGTGFRNLSLGKVSGDFVLLAALGASQDVSLSAQNGNLVVAHSVTGGGDVKITARSGSAVVDGASISAGGELQLTATGALQLLGDHALAKLLARSKITIDAGSILLRAGDWGASIDPSDLVIATAGDLVLQAGTAPAAVAGSTVTIHAGNVGLTGGTGSYAAIQALSGDVNIETPAGGSIVLTRGSGLDADAVITAPGSSAAHLRSGQCIGCDVLMSDPIGNQITETGVFAGTVDFTRIGPGPGAFRSPGSSLPSPDSAVIQASVVALSASTSQTVFGVTNDESNSRKRAVPACPVR